MSKKENLVKAKENKNDEFYTQFRDIEKEMNHYKDHFKNKIVFCNCDDPEWSNFWKYFEICFQHLGLKKLISTHYESNKQSYKLELEKINGELVKTKTDLLQNGDFRSPECVEILKECDIVVTNPPFSLFREYVALLMKYNKKFLIIGNANAITYKEVFPLIKENKIWLGINNGSKTYEIPEKYDHLSKIEVRDNKYYTKLGNTVWYTNLDHKKRHEEHLLYKKYYGNEKEYPKYDNYEAINVEKTKDIPMDYYGVIGVPITFLDKLNPDQFEIIGLGKQPMIKYLEGIKVYENSTIDGKASNTSNAQLCLLLDDIKDLESYKSYLKKPKYFADNANGELVAPYARLLIKRI